MAFDRSVENFKKSTEGDVTEGDVTVNPSQMSMDLPAAPSIQNQGSRMKKPQAASAKITQGASTKRTQGPSAKRTQGASEKRTQGASAKKTPDASTTRASGERARGNVGARLRIKLPKLKIRGIEKAENARRNRSHDSIP